MLKKLLLKAFCSVCLLLLASGCGGLHSTVRQGYAYRISKDQAVTLLDSVMRSEIAGDRILSSGGLVVSGYDRALTDTHTYTASAISVPRLEAYGLEVRHQGTMFKGPMKSKRIFTTLNERAGLMGSRVAFNP